MRERSPERPDRYVAPANPADAAAPRVLAPPLESRRGPSARPARQTVAATRVHRPAVLSFLREPSPHSAPRSIRRAIVGHPRRPRTRTPSARAAPLRASRDGIVRAAVNSSPSEPGAGHAAGSRRLLAPIRPPFPPARSLALPPPPPPPARFDPRLFRAVPAAELYTPRPRSAPRTTALRFPTGKREREGERGRKKEERRELVLRL